VTAPPPMSARVSTRAIDDLAEAVNLTDATVSHHLSQLRKDGLVKGNEQA